MCWIGNQSNKKIATHNMTVYKVLDIYKLDENVLMSPRQQFQYNLGKIYHAKIKPQSINKPNLHLIKISCGLHCYSKKCTFPRFGHHRNVRYNDIHTNLLVHQSDLEAGALHVFRKKEFYFPAVFKCIIPKGTTYYENKAGEIVTETLKIIKLTEF